MTFNKKISVLMAGLLTFTSMLAFATDPPPISCSTCWRPNISSLPWQYQLQSARKCLYPNTNYINTTIRATAWNGDKNVTPRVFDIDIYQDSNCDPKNRYTPVTNAVKAIHANGSKVIAYIDAGSWESWRKDANEYVSFDNNCHHCLLGKSYSGFRNEKWLNISDDGSVMGTNPNTHVLETPAQFIRDELSKRMDDAKTAGFDAIEFDNVDNYINKTGFKITAEQQLTFNKKLANLAHAKGFSVGLKNDLAQTMQLINYFDFAISEQCFQGAECEPLRSWTSLGKAVFIVEYKNKLANFCMQANKANFNAILKTNSLYDEPWAVCRK